MQIKSWHVAAIGGVIQLLTTLSYFRFFKVLYPNATPDFSQTVGNLSALILVLVLIAFFRSNKKILIKIAIIATIIFIALYIPLILTMGILANVFIPLIILLYISPYVYLFLLIASIYYFWKKV